VEEVVGGVGADLGGAVGVLVVEDGVGTETGDEVVVAGGAGCEDCEAGTVEGVRSKSVSLLLGEYGCGTHSFANWMASVPVAVEPP